ncbi:MAG: ABC transporter permease [Ruminiclostridium sp.]|nr:ABC transporter permease [Ruminiclostridium sp.]
MYYLEMYLSFIKVRFQELFQDRISFILSTIVMEASYGADFLLIWLIVYKFRTIGVWGPYEIMFLFALNLMSYSVAGFFLFHPTTRLSSMVRTGRFDEVLTKPLNAFTYLMFRDFNPGYISHIALNIALMIFCIIKLGLSVTLVNVLFLILTIISGALIQGAGFIFTSVPSFWMVQNNFLMETIMYDLKYFIRYPISIYNKFIQIILTFIIPYAFINFYPAQFFLKKNDFLIFHPVFQFLSPVVGILLILGAYRFWLFGISKYESTGS